MEVTFTYHKIHPFKCAIIDVTFILVPACVIMKRWQSASLIESVTGPKEVRGYLQNYNSPAILESSAFLSSPLELPGLFFLLKGWAFGRRAPSTVRF